MYMFYIFRMMFASIPDMIEHKRMYCKLRFTCKCVDGRDNNVPLYMECSLCQVYKYIVIVVYIYIYIYIYYMYMNIGLCRVRNDKGVFFL